MASIESTVRSEIYDFIHNPITVADGYEFNQYENIKKTHLYLNSRFYNSSGTGTDQPLVDGLEQSEDDRIFFNITLPRVRAVKRFFDVDVKDILIDEIDPQSELALQLLNKEMGRFSIKMNEETGQTLSADLNEFRDPLLEYGSLVIEVLGNARPYIVPLQRYFVDPTVKRSRDSRFNTIKYTMSPSALRKKVKDGWDADAIEAIIECHNDKSKASDSYEDIQGSNQVVSTALIDVYKRYGYLPRWMIDQNAKEGTAYGDEEIYTLTITAFGPDVIKKKEGKKDDKDVYCLYKTEWKKDCPIIDHHLYKTHGRWQGVGIVELLYPLQLRMNEVCNQKRISMELSMLHLFQTSDPTVLNNILTDLENGDIIKTKRDGAISKIDNAERNLAATESEIVNYQTQADKMSFANDLLSGGDVPSSTPATNTVIQNNNQVLVHLQDRENFTIFLADNYVTQYVIPKLIEDLDDEHFLRIVSEPEDLLQIDDMMVDIQFWEETKKRALKGSVVDLIQGDELREELLKKLRRKGPNRYVKVLKGYYKNKLNDLFAVIGDEKKDLAKVANNTLSFFQILQNPQMVSDPVMRMFVTQYARDIGMDTSKLSLAFAKRDNEPQPETQGTGRLPNPAPEEAEDPAIAQVL